jgi:hypothetical protein
MIVMQSQCELVVADLAWDSNLSRGRASGGPRVQSDVRLAIVDLPKSP